MKSIRRIREKWNQKPFGLAGKALAVEGIGRERVMCDVMQQPNEPQGDESLEPHDLPSLDFIEDPYLPKLDATVTPSLDEIPEDYTVGGFQLGAIDDHTNDDYYTCDWSADEAEHYLRSLTLDQILDVPSEAISTSVSVGELQTVEAEFMPLKLAASDKLKAKLIRLFTRRSLRDVRVTFIDFSKPYLARVSSRENYKNFLHIGHATGMFGKTNLLLLFFFGGYGVDRLWVCWMNRRVDAAAGDNLLKFSCKLLQRFELKIIHCPLLRSNSFFFFYRFECRKNYFQLFILVRLIF